MLTVAAQASAFADSFVAILPSNILEAPVSFSVETFRPLMRPALPAPDGGERARYLGIPIYLDEDGYFASAGCAVHFGYADTVAEIVSEIDDHFAEEAEHYGDRDTPADTPSLDTSFADGERAS